MGINHEITHRIYSELSEILTRVNKVENNKPRMDSIISSQGVCRFSEKVFSDCPQIVKLAGDGTGDKIISKVVEGGTALFLENQSSDCISILAKGKSSRITRYIDKKYILMNEYISSFNVLIPESNGSGAFEPFSSPVISLPNESFADTFIAIGIFATNEEAENCLKYIRTKFARAMLGTLKVTQHNPKATWANVPLQDFSANSDIDWSRSVAEIDKQLYSKYGLSEAEIAFIESKVREM